MLLLAPLLQAAHVAKGSSTNSIAQAARHLFAGLGIDPTLATALIFYVGGVGTTLGLSAYASVRGTRYTLEFVDSLRNDLYQAIAVSPWRHMLTTRRSDLLNALTVNTMQTSAAVTALLALQGLLLLMVMQVGLALTISPALTALAMLAGVAMTAAALPLVRTSRRLGSRLVDRNQAILHSATEFLDGLKVAKLHALEAPHVQAFADVVTDARQAQTDFARHTAATTMMQTLVSTVLLAVIVYVGVGREHLGASELLILLFLFARLVGQVPLMQRNLQQIAQMVPAYEDLTAATTNARSGAESTDDVPPTERLKIGPAGAGLRGVTTGYSPSRPVLHDVNLSVGARETVALVGPSGAGKTTVVDVLAGLLPPERGAVYVDSRPLEDGLMRQWRSSIAVVTQEPFLLHDTVRANLLWGSDAAAEPQLWQALDVAAATELVQSLPDGLDTVVGDRGVRLSGGERQRIALARAVLRRPTLLILDEATSAVDNENELLIRRALSRLRGELAMLVVAHRLSTASHADRVVVLDGGRVVESGGWEELLELPRGKLRALVEAGSLGIG